MKLVWVLGRAILEAGVAAITHRDSSAVEQYGQTSGAAYLLLAAGIAVLIAAAPGLFIALMLAGFSPGAL